MIQHEMLCSYTALHVTTSTDLNSDLATCIMMVLFVLCAATRRKGPDMAWQFGLI